MDQPQESEGARRNLYLFGTVSLFNDTASEMAYWILPAFLVSLGAGPAALGLIEGIAESVAAMGKLFSGYLTDVVPRRKPVVLAGYALANAVKPLLALTTRWWQVLLIRFVDRTAKGIRGTPRDVMLAESADKKKMGRTYGLLQSMDSAGAIAGPLLAWTIMTRLNNMRAVFWAAVVPGLISVLVLLFLREPERQAPKERERHSFWSPAHLSPRFYYVLAAVLIFSLGNSSDMFLILRAQQTGIAPGLAPLLGLVFNVTYTLTSWPAGWLSDHWPKPFMAASGYLVFAITYFTFAVAPGKAAVWAMMALYGLFYSLTNPVLRALVAETVEPGARGRAFGVFYFSTSIATLLASLLTGELWKHFGAALPFYISTTLAVIAALMLFAARGEAEPLAVEARAEVEVR
jgi:MFS family permease